MGKPNGKIKKATNIAKMLLLGVCSVMTTACTHGPTYSDYAAAYVEEINAKEIDFDDVTPEDLGMSQTQMGGNSYWCPVNYPTNKLCRVTRSDDDTIEVYEDSTDVFHNLRFKYTRSGNNKVIARAVWW